MEKYDDFNKRKKDLDIFMNISQNYKSLNSLLADMALDPPQDSVAEVEAPDKEERVSHSFNYSLGKRFRMAFGLYHSCS